MATTSISTVAASEKTAHTIMRTFLALLVLSIPSTAAFTATRRRTQTRSSSSSSLSMAYAGSSLLKPAAIPLMDAGKAMARSGELLIDLTQTAALDSYGGSLSSVGANIRNCGDCVAQAAASCRFKTGTELVCDELREAAVCLIEAAQNKLPPAVEEAKNSDDPDLAKTIAAMIEPVGTCGSALEAAGAEIMRKSSVANVGAQIEIAGTQLQLLSTQLKEILCNDETADLCSQRMAFASLRMVEAGNELQVAPATKKTANKGKGWIKG